MVDRFDPQSTALQIDREARTCLDLLSHKPIEASESQFALNGQLNALSKSPEHFKQIGQELEKLGNDSFSTLPNVSINARNGSIESIYFYSSALDIKDNKTHILEYKPATQSLDFIRLFY